MLKLKQVVSKGSEYMGQPETLTAYLKGEAIKAKKDNYIDADIFFYVLKEEVEAGKKDIESQYYTRLLKYQDEAYDFKAGKIKIGGVVITDPNDPELEWGLQCIETEQRKTVEAGFYYEAYQHEVFVEYYGQRELYSYLTYTDLELIENAIKQAERELLIKQPPPEPKNLKPKITPEQIQRLSDALKNIFEATLEQWQALFSETDIQLSKPIEAKAPADIAVLFHWLKTKELIETDKFPSIIERTNAFTIKGKSATAKQIADAKNNNRMHPEIGKYYVKIKEAVTGL